MLTEALKSRGRPLTPRWSRRPAYSLPTAVSRKLPARDLSLPLPTLETPPLWAASLLLWPQPE